MDVIKPRLKSIYLKIYVGPSLIMTSFYTSQVAINILLVRSILSFFSFVSMQQFYAVIHYMNGKGYIHIKKYCGKKRKH